MGQRGAQPWSARAIAACIWPNGEYHVLYLVPCTGGPGRSNDHPNWLSYLQHADVFAGRVSAARARRSSWRTLYRRGGGGAGGVLTPPARRPAPFFSLPWRPAPGARLLTLV